MQRFDGHHGEAISRRRPRQVAAPASTRPAAAGVAPEAARRRAARLSKTVMEILLLSAWLTACTAPSASAPTLAPTSTAAPLALPTAIPAGGVVSLALPTRGTPDVNATLAIEAAIVDAATGSPVAADVYFLADQELREPLPDELLARQVIAFRLTLPSTLKGRLLVRAPGYRDWDLRLEYRVETSRVLEGPVELIRVAGEDI